MYNVLISTAQQSDSVTHTPAETYIYIFFKNSIPLWVQDIEYRSLCYTVGLVYLFYI